MKVRPGEELLEPRSGHIRARQSQGPDGFAEEDRFARLGFHHQQARAGDGQRQRNGGDPPPLPTSSNRVVAAGTCLAADQRLNQQPIQRVRRRIRQLEAGQVDLAVPRRQQPVVDLEPGAELGRHRHARTARPAADPILELAAGHWGRAGRVGAMGEAGAGGTGAGRAPGRAGRETLQARPPPPG